MKKHMLISLGWIFISASLSYADQYNFNTLDGLNESIRVVEAAYKSGAGEKDKYHFEKTKAYSRISMFLASELDMIGSKIFAIKSMNSASKAIIGTKTIDPIELVEDDPTFSLNIKELNSRIEYLRGNKGESCAPEELAKAEAYYDALSYEIKKEKQDQIALKKFYNDTLNSSILAEEKLKSAIESGLECYTGKEYLPEVAKAEEETPKPVEEAKKEEPLMITARIHFDFDRYNIKREYMPLLNEVAKTLKDNPNIRVRIEGYTDSIGTKAYNDKLALRRAESVKGYLVKQGISKDRIEIVGYGKEKYIATNKTQIGRLTNRRADFIILRLSSQ
ncbi:MAG: OmpA family protein [Aquificaceae bacterium]